MAAKSAVAIVSTYESDDDALSDYNAVERFYTDDLSIDALNAAVITRRANGRAEVIQRRERSALGPAETELLIGHMTKAGLKKVGVENLDPGQTMLIVVAAGDAWDTYNLEDQIILSGDTEILRITADPAAVFDETLVIASR